MLEWSGWKHSGESNAYPGSTPEGRAYKGEAGSVTFASKPPRGVCRQDARERQVDSIVRKLRKELRQAIEVKYLSNARTRQEQEKRYREESGCDGFRRKVEIAEAQVVGFLDIMPR